MTGKESISVIIVTYNIGRDLKQCFYSILNQVKKVIIVDNGSDKETIEYIKELKSKYDIEIILNSENKGIAYALNQGVKYSLDNGYEWILTMDNDSIANPDMVQVMIDEFNNITSTDKEKIVSIFPKHVGTGLEKKMNQTNTIEFIDSDITSGNLIKSKIFNEVGLFDEKLFIDYVDHEFCYRLKSLGYKMIKVNTAELGHSLGQTESKKILNKDIIHTNHSALRKYYMTRNRIYTWNKYKQFNEIQSVDKKNFMKENIKILLFEKDKLNKFKMIYRGYKDYKNGVWGIYKM